MEEKVIGGISLTTWKKEFADLVRIAIERDCFDRTLFYKLYPNTAVEDKNAQYDAYSEKWKYAYKAFEEIFGEAY